MACAATLFRTDTGVADGDYYVVEGGFGVGPAGSFVRLTSLITWNDELACQVSQLQVYGTEPTRSFVVLVADKTPMIAKAGTTFDVSIPHFDTSLDFDDNADDPAAGIALTSGRFARPDQRYWVQVDLPGPALVQYVKVLADPPSDRIGSSLWQGPFRHGSRCSTDS